MDSTTDDRPTVIGHLEYGVPASSQISRHAILLGEQLLIGRDPGWLFPPKISDLANCESHLLFSDSTISARHLKIYSIVYDTSNTTVKPLIYAEDLSSNGSYWNGSLICKGASGVLLADGDELRISPRTVLTFRTSVAYDEDDLEPHQQDEVEYFQTDYCITRRKLGSGGQGQVYMAVNLTLGRQVACKIVDLKKVRQDEVAKLNRFMGIRDRSKDNESTAQGLKGMSKSRIKQSIEAKTKRLEREVEILQDVSHPNIVRLEKAYQCDNSLYIFEELITGGDLFSYLEWKGGVLEEAEAGLVTRQLLEAIKYLHDRGIVHRDLKPDNILVASLSEASRIVLTDFGHATRTFSENGERLMRMQTVAGTLDYAAPEIHGANATVGQSGYTSAIDMWSLGCVTTALLTGTTPFSFYRNSGKRNPTEMMMNAASTCQLDGLQLSREWQQVSERPKDFVRKLLVLEESSRMTADDAIQHHWFTNKRVKKDFDKAYKKAVAGWKKHSPVPEMIEYIPGFYTPLKQSTRKAIPKLKPAKPVEPHYRPYHRRVDQLLNARPRLSLPPLREVTEEWEKITARLQEEKNGPSPVKSPVKRSLLSPNRELNIGRISDEDDPGDTRDWIQSSQVLKGVQPSIEETSDARRDEDDSSADTPSMPHLHSALRPSIRSSGSVTPVKKRKKQSIFDFDDDEEDQVAPPSPSRKTLFPRIQPCLPESQFTPINGNKSSVLGKRNRDPDSGAGHDRPLHSKQVNELLSPRLSNSETSSLYAHDTENAQEPCNKSESGRAEVGAESETIVKMRRLTSESSEADAHTEVVPESPQFRTAWSYGQELARRRANRKQLSQSPEPPNLP